MGNKTYFCLQNNVKCIETYRWSSVPRVSFRTFLVVVLPSCSLLIRIRIKNKTKQKAKSFYLPFSALFLSNQKDIFSVLKI